MNAKHLDMRNTAYLVSYTWFDLKSGQRLNDSEVVYARHSDTAMLDFASTVRHLHNVVIELVEALEN